MKLMQLINPCVDLFFPPRCVFCNSLLPAGKRGICYACKDRVKFIQEPRCLKCGKAIEYDESEYCLDCASKERDFVRGYPLFSYLPPVSGALSLLKYHGKEEVGQYLGRLLGQHFGPEFQSLHLDAIIPVPVSEKKRKLRGYNQAEIIARACRDAFDSSLPLVCDLLIRKSDTQAQKKLSASEREKNLRKAFTCANEMRSSFAGGRVLLVDDIYTTGATIQACTKALMEVGVEKVYYTSVCAGRGN